MLETSCSRSDVSYIRANHAVPTQRNLLKKWIENCVPAHLSLADTWIRVSTRARGQAVVESVEERGLGRAMLACCSSRFLGFSRQPWAVLGQSRFRYGKECDFAFATSMSSWLLGAGPYLNCGEIFPDPYFSSLLSWWHIVLNSHWSAILRRIQWILPLTTGTKRSWYNL